MDAILGPRDSRTVLVRLLVNLPLEFAHFDGRPFSLHMLAPANEEITWKVAADHVSMGDQVP